MIRLGILVIGAFIISFSIVFGCLGFNPGQVYPPPEGPSPPDTANAVTKEMCDQYHGYWNSCGSACRGAPEGTACVMMCVSYCECGGIAGFQCPPGYVCMDYLPKGAVDAMGICKRVSQ